MGHRWPLAVLAALGVVLAHGAAYTVAAPHGSGAAHGAGDVHGYLQLAVPLVVLAAMAGMGWLIASRSGRSWRLPSTAALASAQALVFVAQELTEHTVAGAGVHSLLGSPALWLGLALQVVVAGVLLWLARAGRAVASRLRFLRHGLLVKGAHGSPAGSMGWPAHWEVAPLRRRGPPRLRVLNLA